MAVTTNSAYPLVDGTANMQKAIFVAGGDSFNQDYQQIVNDEENELLVRFNSIVKASGLVAKKSEVSIRLFPSLVTGNQIKITAGTGFTRNGARIYVATDLTITDLTALPNYASPTSNYMFLVLRKTSVDEQLREHRITGNLNPTRRRITYNPEWINAGSLSGTAPANVEALSDKDVVVLGRLTSVSPVTFDTTEKTGLRRVLRLTEALTAEVSGFVLEGDIDFNNLYEALNLPQWGTPQWKINGAVNNKDFHRLFSKVNSTLAVIRGVKFTSISGGYGLQFANDDTVKIKIFPNQKPPQSVDVISQNESVTIPDNNVLYITLTDSQLLLSGTGGGTESDSPSGSSIISGGFTSANFLTSSNLGNASGDLKRFPICWHYFNPTTLDRLLVFADGTILKVDDEINSHGRHSAYLRREGYGSQDLNNYMTGDVNIIKNSGKILLTQDSVSSSDITTGVQWKKELPFNSVTIAELQRFISGTGGSDAPAGLSNYDIFLSLFDQDGLNGKNFIFKKDGRLQIDSPASSSKDALRLGEGFDKRGEGIPNNSITGTPRILKDNPQIIFQDTTSTLGFQGIAFQKSDGGGIGYIERESEGGSDAVFPSWNEGDLLFASTDNAGGSAKGFRLKRDTGHLEAYKLLSSSDGTIGQNLYVFRSVFVGHSDGESGNNVSAYYLENGYVPSAIVYPANYRGIHSVDTGSLVEEPYRWQLRTNYNGILSSDVYLANYSDTTTPSYTTLAINSATLQDTQIAVKIPTDGFNRLQVTLNYTLFFAGVASGDSYVLQLKNSAGTVIKGIIETPPNAGSTAKISRSRVFHLSSAQLQGADSLKLWARKSLAGDNSYSILNDSTTGASDLSVVVLN